MEWYQQWFNEKYLIVYDHRDTDEAEQEALTISRVLDLRENDFILDLCCGSGRHEIPLVRMGYRVIGLDYSDHMIKIAQASRLPGSEFPQYIRADARKIPFCDGVFDIVLNLFTSFGYFSDEENYTFLLSISRLLKPDGRFYIDYLNPPYVLANLVEESMKEKDEVKIVEKRNYDSSNHRIEKTIVIEQEKKSEVFHESVRLYNYPEMLCMIKDAGLNLEGVFGNINGDPYYETSERMILFGSKTKAVS